MSPIVVVRNVSRDFPAIKGRSSLFKFLRSRLHDPATNPRRLVALEDISFTIAPGEKIGVVGNNAAGKTTLLKILAGLLRPTKGEVHVGGEMILLTALGVGMMD